MKEPNVNGYILKFWFLTAVNLFLVLFLAGCSGGENDAANNDFTIRQEHSLILMSLLDASQSAMKANALDLQAISNSTAGLTDSSVIWPFFIFLSAEVCQQREDDTSARHLYRSLAEWAASDSYRDDWGGSGLAAIALWRWLQLVKEETSPDSAESLHLIEIADRMLNTRLVSEMFYPHHTHLLSSMPKLEEDIRRNLAKLAWKADARDKAGRLFLDYLEISSIPDLDPVENQIMDHLIESRLVTRDHLKLFRGKRLESLGKYKEAYDLLKQVHTESANLQVRAEAGLHLANIEPILDEHKKVAKRGEVAELLSSVLEDAGDPDVAQRALFNRAMLLNREGEGQNQEQVISDLKQLAKEFPDGQLADDALFELARYYQDAGDVEEALSYFKRVQRFEGENDRFDTSHFQAALTLYNRGRPTDIKRAMAILHEYVDRHPFGPLYLNALFWIGRMASEKGDKSQAERYFKLIIKTSPWDYYAIRARMHLNLGDAARKEYLPDPVTSHKIRLQFESSRIDSSLNALSPYHSRVDYAVRSGLYTKALASEQELVTRFTSRRLEHIEPSELDSAGLMARISLLLALRQDVLAAADMDNSPDNRLSIGGIIGYLPSDWTLSIGIVEASGKPSYDRAAFQRDERYLATAYPTVFNSEFRKAAKKYEILPECIYGVSRRESYFYPTALSKKGALGLFQFTPETFRGLNDDWRLLDEASSMEAFLLDPDSSIELWARWFSQRLLRRYDGDYFLAILDHISGLVAVRAWVRHWQSIGRADDIEYMVETCKFVHTRIIARGVLTDMAIVQAAGMFESE